MAMDKRSSARMKLHLDLNIYHCGNHLGRGTTRDINTNGAFIQDYTGELYRNDVVELTFIPYEEECKPVCLKGMVVRGSRKGIAIMFGYGETDFGSFLGTFIKNAEKGRYACAVASF